MENKVTITKAQYEKYCKRLEEIEPLVNEEDLKDPIYIEFVKKFELCHAYEQKHVKLEKPTLVQMVKYKMVDLNLNQAKLAQLLDVRPSTISDFFHGKYSPSLTTARKISIKLDIAPEIVLGI